MKYIPQLKIKFLNALNSSNEPLTSVSLAKLLDISQVLSSRMLLWYYKQGIVKRERNPGEKSYKYKISEHGKKRLEYFENNKITPQM